MPIERSKDGNINNNNFLKIVSKVVKISDDKWDKKLQQTIQEYAKLVTACDHTFKNIEQCDALPLPSNDKHMKLFQAFVIMDSSKNRLPCFSNMTDEELDKWHTVGDEYMKNVIDVTILEYLGDDYSILSFKLINLKVLFAIFI